ncbi:MULTISPECIES: CAP domain-containing protein [unclassified Anabaena]|uniref:CAP domain-containing protein n=1 Tax=unclassified Anabaena TaxID=2619674 RepID=UPI00082E2002|nr:MULTISPECIES: CAP domain-containing protein [unclassified Anabaena]
MIRTTLYSFALGSFLLATGASAVSLPSASVQPKSSSIENHLAQYFPGQYFPRQYNRRSRPYNRSIPSSRQRPYNPGTSNSDYPGEQSNPSSSREQSNPSSSREQSNSGSSRGGSNSNTASIEQSVFEQINEYRASIGLPALSRNSAIDEQARIHSQNMASGKVPFSHQGFDQRVKAIGIAHKSASENVAYNQDRDAATRAVQSWLKSSGHLANIKSNANTTGVGVAVNGRGVVYLTQIFMRS